MLSRDELRDLIHLRMTEAEALERLALLTPDCVTETLLDDALNCLRETAHPFEFPDLPVMDCCGTGGSGLPHFNTSTTVAFILAAAGVPVVKFGNRAMSSQSGSFDLLEQLGFSAEIPFAQLEAGLAACNLMFLYAPQCYPKLAPFNRLRKTLKHPTLFNFTGPLLNPVRPAYRLLGVSHAGMQNHAAQQLANTPECQQAWVVRGLSGLDELDIHGPSRVLQIQAGQCVEIALQSPFNPPSMQNTTEHSPQHNFSIFNGLLKGEDTASPYYQMVCLNAGAGLHIARRAKSLEDGIALAQETLQNGQALQTLEKCRRFHDAIAS